MANLVTFGEVRNIIGIGSDIITDDEITALITEVQKKAISYFNVFITPTKYIEIKDGNNKNQLMINKPYIWKILELKTSNSDFDLNNVTIDINSGIITVNNTQSPYFFSAYQNAVKIKYLSAFMEKTVTITESSVDVEAGTSVAIAVDDESDFSVDDWILIEGTDGKREAAQITATDTDEITVDLLVQDHESESIIVLLQTHELFRQFILYESAVSAAINSVGGSYNFAAGYTMPEYTVQLGVPYVHFEKIVNSNIKQRDIVKQQIYNKLNALS